MTLVLINPIGRSNAFPGRIPCNSVESWVISLDCRQRQNGNMRAAPDLIHHFILVIAQMVVRRTAEVCILMEQQPRVLIYGKLSRWDDIRQTILDYATCMEMFLNGVPIGLMRISILAHLR